MTPAHRDIAVVAADLGLRPLDHRAAVLVDALVELKAVCECGRKATMNLRVDEAGRAVVEGAQTEIGGNDRYVAMCRRHFMAKRREAAGVLADA